MTTQLLQNVYQIRNGDAIPLKVEVQTELADSSFQDLYALGMAKFEQGRPFIHINSVGCLRMGEATRFVDVYYDVKRDQRWAVAQLPHLHFKTMYALDEDGFEVPSFPPSGAGALSAVAMMAEDMYEVPLNLFENAGWYVYALLQPRTTEVYILAISPDECMLLPIPNQYDSGKMCMGAQFEPGIEGLLERMSNTVESFLASLWNQDLYSDYKQSRMQKLFRFKDGVYQGLRQPEDSDIMSSYDYIKSLLIGFGPNQALTAVIEEIQKELR